MARILVTGSRDWTDFQIIYSALNEVTSGQDMITLVAGGAVGADEMAQDWARSVYGWGSVEEYPYPSLLGPRGGPLRNEYMVGLGADICLAFIMPCVKEKCAGPPVHGSHGATQCLSMAVKYGIPTRRFTPEGEVK